MQSTQRAESIHHAVKTRTSSSGLLVQLAETLLSYADGAAMKHETSRARDILLAGSLSFSNQTGHMALVQNLQDKVSSHAMDIIKAQQAQAMAYYVEPEGFTPDGMQIYCVKRSCEPPSLMKVADERIQEDFALPRSTASGGRVRHTLLDRCTCQFSSCWGLPCRHMLRLYLHLQISEVPQGVVKARWITHDATYIAEQKRNLMRMAPMRILSSACDNNRQYTRSDRYTYLLSEFKSLGEVASLTEETMNMFVKHLDDFRAEIAAVQLPVATNAHSFNPELFPNGLVLNPGVPLVPGRPQSTRIRSSGENPKGKRQKKSSHA